MDGIPQGNPSSVSLTARQMGWCDTSVRAGVISSKTSCPGAVPPSGKVICTTCLSQLFPLDLLSVSLT